MSADTPLLRAAELQAEREYQALLAEATAEHEVVLADAGLSPPVTPSRSELRAAPVVDLAGYRHAT